MRRVLRPGVPGRLRAAALHHEQVPAEETAERATTAVISQCTAAGGIMFVYKPAGVGTELPPTYESLFTNAEAAFATKMEASLVAT